MKYPRHLIIGAAILLLFGMGPDYGWSQGANVILPVDANGNPVPGPPFIKIYTLADADITESWMPHPETSVKIKVVLESGAIVENPAINLVEWSSYPGICTNYPASGGNEADFELAGSVLTPSDHGGWAKVTYDGSTFVLPQDSDNDKIADIYEIEQCGSSTCLAPEEDADQAPVAGSSEGDGIAAIDEYRGFRINGEYKRTSTGTKDLFVGLSSSAQCQNDAFYFDSNGNPISLVTYFSLADGSLDINAVFGNLYTLIPDGIAVHYIKNDEWQNFFAGYTVGFGVIISGNTDEERTANAQLDRQVNTNALIPYNPFPDGIVKGVRLVECLDLVQALDPLGIADKNPPDLWDKDNGNAIVYTQRVLYNLEEKFEQGPNRQLKYFTFEGGNWVDKWTSNYPVTVADKGFIIQKALPWYVAHEIIHCTDLTETDESTRREPAGYHHVSKTGTNIDVKIVHVVDKKEFDRGFNKFYIPINYNDSDKRDMRLLGIQ